MKIYYFIFADLSVVKYLRFSIIMHGNILEINYMNIASDSKLISYFFLSIC